MTVISQRALAAPFEVLVLPFSNSILNFQHGSFYNFFTSLLNRRTSFSFLSSLLFFLHLLYLFPSVLLTSPDPSYWKYNKSVIKHIHILQISKIFKRAILKSRRHGDSAPLYSLLDLEKRRTGLAIERSSLINIF